MIKVRDRLVDAAFFCVFGLKNNQKWLDMFNCENWMSTLPEELRDIPLTHLAIPGIFYLCLNVFPLNTYFAKAAYENGT